MPLPPIFYHIFRQPLPYLKTLHLQESIHKLQLSQKLTNTHKDVLLLLQHRPVFTAGRRQSDDSVKDERERLMNIGADFVSTKRGGELTYHGPGQIVGYPLLDLGRPMPAIGVRDYICFMQTTLKRFLKEVHGVETTPSDNTGVFLDSISKIASIGVQMRHRLTTHGFSINITKEPLGWFNQVVACGLADVHACCIQDVTGQTYVMEEEMKKLAEEFGKVYKRDMVPLVLQSQGELGELILALEEETRLAGEWAKEPKLV